jgi:hypothetical protein
MAHIARLTSDLLVHLLDNAIKYSTPARGHPGSRAPRRRQV